ncbi:hypothetical protein [Virgisporangium aliadipatigenens]|nr:hypothetical protein [Virgisporangium aliadipatigenens]
MTITVEQGRWLLGAPPTPRPLPRRRIGSGFDFDVDRLRLMVLAALFAILFVMSL